MNDGAPPGLGTSGICVSHASALAEREVQVPYFLCEFASSLIPLIPGFINRGSYEGLVPSHTSLSWRHGLRYPTFTCSDPPPGRVNGRIRTTGNTHPNLTGCETCADRPPPASYYPSNCAFDWTMGLGWGAGRSSSPCTRKNKFLQSEFPKRTRDSSLVGNN